MKTGRGKTHIVFQLINLFQCTTLILCHNIKVAHETKEKLIQFTNIQEGEVSLLTSKSRDKEIKKITITTHKNFKDNYEIFQGNFQQIIYDECDINISYPTRNNHGHSMTNCIIMSDADIIRGLTGTPYRNGLGQEPLIKLFGDIIQQPDQENNGYNMIPSIIQLQHPAPLYMWTTWSELIKQMAEDSARQYNQLNSLLKYHRNKSLVLYDSRMECDIMTDLLLQHAEIPVIKMYGGQTVRETADNLQLLRESNEYIIVGTSDMMGRGVDIPGIDTVFMYAAMKFKGTIVQAVGRCLRFSKDKLAPVIVDWCDLPLLNKQMRERTKSYKLEYGKDILIDKIKL